MRVAWWLMVWLAGCAAQTPLELSRIYEPDAQRGRDLLPTLAFVPGVLGSQIVDADRGDVYWGAFFGDAKDPSRDPVAARKFALPIDPETALGRSQASLGPGSVLHLVELHTFAGQLKLRGYPGVLEGLADAVANERVGAVRRPSSSDLAGASAPITGVGYDWRWDVSHESARLDARVREAVARRRAAGDSGVRGDVIGHSMGALLVRYWLRYGATPLPVDGSLPPLSWAGADLVDDVFLLGPPNRGSAEVFLTLLEGERPNPILPAYPPALVGTFPSLYGMLPRVEDAVVQYEDGRAVDLFDVEVWDRHGWGLLGGDQDATLATLLPDVSDPAARRAAAKAHLAACLRRAAQLHRALDVPADPPAGLRIHLFQGDSRPTPGVVVIRESTGAVLRAPTVPGDGRVSRASALGGASRWAEAWTSAHFSDAEHFGIVKDPEVLDNLLFLLLHGDRPAR